MDPSEIVPNQFNPALSTPLLTPAKALSQLIPLLCSYVPILRLNVVGHCLRLLITLVRVIRVIRWPDVLHLVDATAFITALERPSAGDLF